MYQLDYDFETADVLTTLPTADLEIPVRPVWGDRRGTNAMGTGPRRHALLVAGNARLIIIVLSYIYEPPTHRHIHKHIHVE